MLAIRQHPDVEGERIHYLHCVSHADAMSWLQVLQNSKLSSLALEIKSLRELNGNWHLMEKPVVSTLRLSIPSGFLVVFEKPDRSSFTFTFTFLVHRGDLLVLLPLTPLTFPRNLSREHSGAVRGD